MAKYSKVIVCLVLGLQSNAVMTQLTGEGFEATPEFLDENFSDSDRKRVAAGFSDVIPDGIPTNTVSSITRDADMILRGRVIAQEYHYDERGVPATHTTFLVSERLKGDHSKNQVTLVQPGGPDRNNAEKIMMSSHAHYFNVGEEEMLFLETDAESMSPFRRVSVMSRYRVFEEKLYSDDGRGVTLVPLQSGDDYRIAQGKVRNSDPRFKKIFVGTRQFNKNFDEIGQEKRRTGRSNRIETTFDGALQEGIPVSVFVELVKKSRRHRP